MRTPPLGPPGRLGVFTTAEALAAGWTHAALKHAVGAGDLTRPYRGVFVPARDTGPGPADRLEAFRVRSVAAVLALRRAVASHRSAAALAGLPLWSPPSLPCLTVPPRRTGDATATHLHRAALPAAHVLPGDVARTRSARTVIDIAREHGLEDAVVVGDAALASGRCTTADLHGVLATCTRWPGVTRARAVLDLLDGRSESPLETISRLRLGAAGLPAPEPQVEIVDAQGIWLGRVDFYWDEYGVFGEVDGRMKYRADPESVVWRERRRHYLLEETGLLGVRWTRADLDRPGLLAARLRAAFARGTRQRAWTAHRTDFAPRMDAISAS